MTIQWYPGHMHKAQKEMRKALPEVDLLIEVLDARLPFSSENPMIRKIRGDKTCIKVFNKSDLADPVGVRLWQEHLEREKNVKTLSLSADDPGRIKKLPDLCRKLTRGKLKSVEKLRAMIVGIPNVGKSSIINTLAGRAVAKTGNEPAVTKGQQYIRVTNDFYLLDTPGMLWPKQEYEASSYRLAATGAIKDTAMDYTDIAFFAAAFMMQIYPEQLCARYGLSQLPDSEMDFFEIIGKERGCLRGGARVDLTKISEIFIKEFREGRLGKICMETPEMVAKEVAAAELVSAESASKKRHKQQ